MSERPSAHATPAGRGGPARIGAAGRTSPQTRQAFEPSQRLSQDAIWGRQRRYFAEAGIEAWRRGGVPSYVTTNPYIAGAYADLASTMLDAWARSRRAVPSAGVPLIVELGAGSGRFAHHVLTQLEAEGAPARMRYVMTDVSPATIAFWRTHERFAPFVASGRLDFACLDTGIDPAARLEISGEPLACGSDAPLIVIANYVFDGIPQDAFTAQAGVLSECLVRPPAAGPGHGMSADARLDYAMRPCNADYYDDPSWNRVLADYARDLRHGAFLFPTEALACLAQLRNLTRGPLLVLSCDRGQTRLDAFAEAEPPQPLVHGSFSLPVNYHALLGWTRQAGGVALAPAHDHASIAVVALGFGLTDAEARVLVRAYETGIGRFGPDDFFMLKKAAQETHDRLDLPQIMALLRLSRWDPAILLICYDRIVALMPEAAAGERRDLAAGLDLMWRRHLDLGEAQDLAFSIGSLLAGMGFMAEAVPFFETSLARHGDDPATLRNLAHCRAAGRAAAE